MAGRDDEQAGAVHAPAQIDGLGRDPLATRVLFTHIDMRFGGVERQLLTLLGGLDPSAYSVDLGLCRMEGDMLSELPASVRVHELGILPRRRNMPTLAWRLARLMRRERPAVVVSFHPALNAVTSAARLVSLTRPGTIGSYPGQVTPGLLDPLRQPLIRRLDAVACVTHDAALNAKRIYGEECHTVVIHNAVDVSRIRLQMAEPVSHPWLSGAREAPVGVTVGRLIASKGVGTVLRATAIINETMPFRLLVVGDGPESANLVTLSRDLGIEDRVDFVGYSSGPSGLVSRADVFLFGSMSEGLPTVLLEAMACGVPIVSTAYEGGVDELLTTGTTGIVVPLNDSGGLARNALRILSHPGTRRDLIENAKREVEERFGSVRYVEEYCRLIQGAARWD